MKKLINLILMAVVVAWGFSNCSTDKSKRDLKVLKQVKVAAATANLRTGPGTDYDVAVGHNSEKRVVQQGTVLNVVAAENDWYEVLVDEDSCTAFIKQSLCAELNGAVKGKKKEPKHVMNDDPGVPATSSQRVEP